MPVTLCSADDSTKVLAHTLLPPSSALTTSDAADSKDAELEVTVSGEGLVRANPGAVGYYRVHYDKATAMPAVIDALTGGHLKEAERLALLDDCFALVGRAQKMLYFKIGACTYMYKTRRIRRE